MYITHKLINFINSSSTISNSTIILTDLYSVILVSSYNNCANMCLNHPISNYLKNIIILFSNDIKSIDYINSSMNYVVPVTVDGNFSMYQSQIILPIVHNNSIDGLLIFMADDRKYINSNLKFAKTTKHFIELLSS